MTKRSKEPAPPKIYGNEVSVPTGRFWPCPLNNTPVHPHPIAVPIKKGPKKYFFRCVCGSHVFLGPGFDIKLGLPPEEARKRGFVFFTTA